MGECYWSDCFVALLCHRVFPIPILPGLVVTIVLGSLVKCTRQDDKTHWLTLFFSLGVSNFLESIFVLFSCLKPVLFGHFFPKVSRTFAKYCIVPRNNFISVFDVGCFDCRMAFIFPSFVFVAFSLVWCPSQIVSVTKVFRSSVLYPASRSFSNFVSEFALWFSLFPFATNIISSRHN